MKSKKHFYWMMPQTNFTTCTARKIGRYVARNIVKKKRRFGFPYGQKFCYFSRIFEISTLGPLYVIPFHRTGAVARFKMRKFYPVTKIRSPGEESDENFLETEPPGTKGCAFINITEY